MPLLQHAGITVHIFYRARRDSDAVRARHGFQRYRNVATRNRHHSVSPLHGFTAPSPGPTTALGRPSRSP
jgi:hypothetical protein